MDSVIQVEMHFCRRCGAALHTQNGIMYECTNGHTMFANASPATAIVLLNDQNEVLVVQRNIEPFKGSYDIPGGFCDGAEPSEAAIERELQEELKITPDQYTPLQFVCTGIDPYPFGGEVLPVHCTVFTAHTKGTVVPQLDHENSAALFVSFADLDIDAIRFPAVRQGLRAVRDQLA